MKIVINSTSNEDLETLSFESINNLHENFKQLLSFKSPLEVKIYAINESITSHQLSKIKNNFDKKLDDPVWKFLSMRMSKYDSFLHIDVIKYRKILKSIVV